MQEGWVRTRVQESVFFILLFFFLLIFFFGDREGNVFSRERAQKKANKVEKRSNIRW